MNARRFGLLVSLFALILGARFVWAVDQADYLNPSWGTQPTAIMGGDTPATYQVTCASATTPIATSNATLVRPAVTVNQAAQASGRPLRKRCFHNAGTDNINIGTSTLSSIDYWPLGASTNTATSPDYCTHNSGAFYCVGTASATGRTLDVIEETQSLP